MKATRWAFLTLATLAILQVVWWAYLVINQQNMIADLVATPEAFQKARSYRTMILFEGAFFFFVWSLGVWYAYKAIRSEIQTLRDRRSFLSAITHELKTPLSTIQLSLETISRPQITEEQRQKFIYRSLKACKKLYHQIETILTYNESEKISSKEVFLISDLLKDLSLHVNEIVRFPVDIPNVQVHANYVESKAILKNILNNAVKYTSTTTNPNVDISIALFKTTVRLTIKDNGIGLSEEDLKRVFTPFWRSESAKKLALEGSGLGLTLSAKLANKNHIQLQINSEGSNLGTVVHLGWPIYVGTHGKS